MLATHSRSTLPRSDLCFAQNIQSVVMWMRRIELTRVEDVSNVVEACCLPCSCDVKTCTENGNCCLSKLFSDVVIDNQDDYVADVHNDVSDTNDTFSWLRWNETRPLHSKCIKAIRDSYVDKNVPELECDLSLPSYFMITQCLGTMRVI